ncbi:HAD domain-containing protein [Chitinophaga rhizophila]|uniref:FCP1 homology domain-containing protein n=1 Tax=Chitinophaga rhizophila TaxID=2866212 RepID=A0ABS7G719_9BACT|nr:HAD domain-containing protein [Chitinophaga rhizophila]MBW8683424.1 hypothetical protein [Chitinophaga rhizophila]
MLVFLDIDGVMVPCKSHKLPDFLADGFAAFSTAATRTLNRLLSEYNATIMLTTSHKEKYSLAKWEDIFSKRGIDVTGKIQSLPANVDHQSRKSELINWFNLHSPAKDFVILDDDKGLNDLPRFLKEHLILTSPYIGLTENHLSEIDSMVDTNGQVSY